MKIIINERQEQLLMNTILTESATQELGPKRLEIKKYLDSGFQRASTPQPDENNKASKKELVVQLYDGKPMKAMTDKDLFNHLQSLPEFRDILSPEERDKFIKDTMIAWYYNKINKRGNIIP